MAYQSDASGRLEIYVQPFPGPGPRRPISTDGGADTRWSRDGHELFYTNGDKLMAVTVATGPTFSAGAPRVLFEGRYRLSSGSVAYDVSPDGRRFLRVQRVQPERPANRIDVVLNWLTELKQLASAK